MTDINKVTDGLKWHLRTMKAGECVYALVNCPYVEECKANGAEKLFEDTLDLLEQVKQPNAETKFQEESKNKNMDDFKAALKLCIDKSEAKAKTELLRNFLDILYASAFGDGQQYMLDREEE